MTMGPIGVDLMKRTGLSSGAYGTCSAIETIEIKRGAPEQLVGITMRTMVVALPQMLMTNGQAALSGTLLGILDGCGLMIGGWQNLALSAIVIIRGKEGRRRENREQRREELKLQEMRRRHFCTGRFFFFPRTASSNLRWTRGLPGAFSKRYYVVAIPYSS